MSIALLIILLQIVNIGCSIRYTDGDYLEMEIIPKSILCPFCKMVIDYHQQQMKLNPNYIEELQKSCKSLGADKRNELNLCQSQFSEKRIQKLRTMSPEDICKDELICGKNKKPESATFEPYRGEPDFKEIPEIDEADRLANGTSILDKILNFSASKLTFDPNNQITLNIDLNFKTNDGYIEGSGNN